MKEHPILFNADMVNAILDGKKTQTRRVIKKAPKDWLPVELDATTDEGYQTVGHSGLWADATDPNAENAIRCPYGIPGDELWVRETHAVVGTCDPGWTLYRANGYENECRRHGFDVYLDESEVKWTPSIFMPRWASRIQLEVTKVRVQRLKQITYSEIRSEGIGCPKHDFDSGFCLRECDHLAQAWIDLWDSINADEHPWGSDPWVWVPEFKIKSVKALVV